MAWYRGFLFPFWKYPVESGYSEFPTYHFFI
nr:MAG TPA: hypothetical protein [Caudoviricetes sp.]